MGMPTWRYSSIWRELHPESAEPTDDEVEEQIALSLSTVDHSGVANAQWIEWEESSDVVTDAGLYRWLLEHDPDYRRMDRSIDSEIDRLRRCCARLKLSNVETEQAVQDWLRDAPCVDKVDLGSL